MKNREKYKNELMNAIKKDGRICGFVGKHGICKMFGRDEESFCGKTDCVDCGVALQLWFDEEYEESPKPEVDWSKVPVDTLVRVRNCENDNWRLVFFKGFGKGADYPYLTFENRQTSKTANGQFEVWKYCELVEDEDGNSSI